MVEIVCFVINATLISLAGSRRRLRMYIDLKSSLPMTHIFLSIPYSLKDLQGMRKRIAYAHKYRMLNAHASLNGMFLWEKLFINSNSMNGFNYDFIDRLRAVILFHLLIGACETRSSNLQSCKQNEILGKVQPHTIFMISSSNLQLNKLLFWHWKD